MTDLSAVNFNHIIAAITRSPKPVNILWQTPLAGLHERR